MSTVSEAEALAARAFLQRAEVRLSTLHRVAGAFLSGAALLVLLPVVLKDVLLTLVVVTVGLPVDTVLVGALVVALIAIAIAPLYAVYSLFRDLVEFYFTHDYPGAEGAKFYPRFILSGITISKDEAPSLKVDVQRREMEATPFVVGDDRERRNTIRVHKAIGMNLITKERWALVEAGGTDLDKEKRRAYWVDFALAGSDDRTTAEEVAKTEASLTRHLGLLRRLVLRYAKAVLALSWATLIYLLLELIQALFHRSASVQPPVSALEIAAVITLGAVWSLLACWVVRRPVLWIGRGAAGSPGDAAHDRHLVRFEIVVLITAGVVLASELVALLVAFREWPGDPVLAVPAFAWIVATFSAGSFFVSHIRRPEAGY
ncbi:MAG: hypothetical protein QOJ81_417 [Chloroflexota bacterium]|nr:hypothetical protein [Chloroflexota bacterium]